VLNNDVMSLLADPEGKISPKLTTGALLEYRPDLGSNTILNLSNTFSVFFSLPRVPDGRGLQHLRLLYWLLCTKKAQSSPDKVFEMI
jgi:hypothetical protein